MSNYYYVGNGIFASEAELYHYGVPGMKWGRRRYQNTDGSLTPAGQKRYGARLVRGHAGPGVYIGDKRKIAGAKKDLQILDRGGHLSVGLTKKRQAAYDKRDRELLNKTISEAEARLNAKEKNKEAFRSAQTNVYSAISSGAKLVGNSLKRLDNKFSEAEARNRAKVAKKKKKDAFRSARKDVYSTRSTGAKLATNILAGPFANRTYNSVIASGGSKNEARAMTAVAAIIGSGGPFGHLAVSALYTHDAGKK